MNGRSSVRVGVRMILCMAVVAVVLWSGLARAEVTNPDGVAVVIGNKDYAHTEDVEFAHRDAEAFVRFVVDVLGFDPKRVMLMRDAPLTQMIDTFGRKDYVEGTELWSRLKPGRSDVVVFYSGHGVPGLRDKRGYLMPVDARPEKAELMGYSLDLLHENLGKLDTRSVTVFVDSCFSGDSEAGMLFEDVSAVRYAARLPEGEKVTMITAAAGNEVALWDREAGHGLFTRHLLDGLYGDADADRDGRITAGEAKSYLDKHMTSAAREGPRRRTQTATLRGGEDRVLVVARFPGRSSPDSRAMAAELAKTRQEKEAVSRQRDRLAEALKAKEAVLVEMRAEKDALEQRRVRLAREVEAERAELVKARHEQERLAVVVAEQEAELKRLRERPRRKPEPVKRGRKVGDVFKDCEGCPVMVVVPAGEYVMGSSRKEDERYVDVGPRHQVRIGEAFAVGKYEVTYEEWEECVAGGGCGRRYGPDLEGLPRARRLTPKTASWEDAKGYVGWLTRKTGKEYRLLSESEWEYVARAGTTTMYWWGDEFRKGMANCDGCGSMWDNKTAAPVGLFKANGFGLYDVHGNVSEWVEDCWHGSYAGAPADGSAWTSGGDCSKRVVRGGSFVEFVSSIRSAVRRPFSSGKWSAGTGFRVATTLTP